MHGISSLHQSNFENIRIPYKKIKNAEPKRTKYGIESCTESLLTKKEKED